MPITSIVLALFVLATPQVAAPPPANHGALPSVSPDGKHIAFDSKRDGKDDLFVIDADGSHEMRLTNTPEDESSPYWSTDGKHIVFSTFADETSKLYGIDPDGKNQRQIGTVTGRSPMLSPDSRTLVYMAGTWTATKVMTLALDSKDPKQITDGSSIAWNIHWSPDGKRLAYTGRNAPKSELAVYVMNADGTGQRQVTHIAADDGGAQWPVWSPDGKQLAVQVNSRKAKSAHIWIVDVESGEARKLAAHDKPYLDETPSWFPDGKKIAFQSNRTGVMEVWTMNVDGSGARQVTGKKK